MELVRGKNKFRALDPTHLRMMLYNLELVVEWRDEATGCAPRRAPPLSAPWATALHPSAPWAAPFEPSLRCPCALVFDAHTHPSNPCWCTRSEPRRRRCFVELQAHHLLILKHNDASDSSAHYEFFRSHLRAAYASSLDANLDFLLEKRMRVFDAIGAVPVLLSLLILCLRSQGDAAHANHNGIGDGDDSGGGGGDHGLDATGAGVRLPGDKFELYSFAMSSMLHQACPGREGVARRMLRHIAAANHLAQRRTFQLDDARRALSAHPDELALFLEQMAGGAIPIIKILSSDGDRSGEFQFKHLSFQEALFCEALIAGEAAAFWRDDASAAAALNDPFCKNALSIGAGGHLGYALARRRPVWSFCASPRLVDDHPDRGMSALHGLLEGATSLAALTLPLAPSDGGVSVSSGEEDEAVWLAVVKVPTALQRDFHAGYVCGIPGSKLRLRRHLRVNPLDPASPSSRSRGAMGSIVVARPRATAMPTWLTPMRKIPTAGCISPRHGSLATRRWARSRWASWARRSACMPTLR